MGHRTDAPAFILLGEAHPGRAVTPFIHDYRADAAQQLELVRCVDYGLVAFAERPEGPVEASQLLLCLLPLGNVAQGGSDEGPSGGRNGAELRFHRELGSVLAQTPHFTS